MATTRSLTKRNHVERRMRHLWRSHDDLVISTLFETMREALGIHLSVPFPPSVALPACIARDQAAMDRWFDKIIAQLPTHTRYDRYLPWLAREFKDLGVANRGPQTDEQASDVLSLRRGLRVIVDWASAEGIDLNQYTGMEALEIAEAWSDWRKPPAHPGTVVFEFGDGWTVQELSSKEQLEDEGAAMGNCLDTYTVDADGTVREPAYEPWLGQGAIVRIFSLRDPRGRPHTSMEWKPEGDARSASSYVSQVRGRGNQTPKREYLMRMARFRLDTPELGHGWQWEGWADCDSVSPGPYECSFCIDDDHPEELCPHRDGEGDELVGNLIFGQLAPSDISVAASSAPNPDRITLKRKLMR